MFNKISFSLITLFAMLVGSQHAFADIDGGYLWCENPKTGATGWASAPSNDAIEDLKNRNIIATYSSSIWLPSFRYCNNDGRRMESTDNWKTTAILSFGTAWSNTYECVIFKNEDLLRNFCSTLLNACNSSESNKFTHIYIARSNSSWKGNIETLFESDRGAPVQWAFCNDELNKK